MIPIFARSFVDHLINRERQHEAANVAHYNTTSMPIDLDLPSSLRDPQHVALLVAHVTDVDGGFGVASAAVKRWRGLLERGKVPIELLVQLPDATDLGGSSYTLALLERYSRIAYHWIGSRRVGVVHNHPLSLRTSHGDGGNVGGGWALDVGHNETLSAAARDAGLSSLDAAIEHIIEHGAGRVIVCPHRCFSAARRGDTDRVVWQTIVRPTVDRWAASGANVVIGYNTAHGGGRPIPRSWDDRALYDDRGRWLGPSLLAA